MHTHEVALEAGQAGRAQADGKQGHGAGDGQGDPGGGVPCPARRGGRDDAERLEERNWPRFCSIWCHREGFISIEFPFRKPHKK
jgi:hypothetical protein